MCCLNQLMGRFHLSLRFFSVWLNQGRCFLWLSTVSHHGQRWTSREVVDSGISWVVLTKCAIASGSVYLACFMDVIFVSWQIMLCITLKISTGSWGTSKKGWREGRDTAHRGEIRLKLYHTRHWIYGQATRTAPVLCCKKGFHRQLMAGN